MRPTAAGQPRSAFAKVSQDIDLPDDTLAWKARAALRADNGKPRWQQVMQAINAMSATEQRDPAWVYWKARALIALAPDSQDGRPRPCAALGSAPRLLAVHRLGARFLWATGAGRVGPENHGAAATGSR